MSQRRIDLIYCAQGNKRLAQIAINNGFLYGSQLPGTTHFPIYFADQDWKKPNREAYVRAIREKKPNLASVLDWEKWSQYCEVMSWAEEIAQFVDEVMIIPKIPNSVASVPETIGGKPVRIGYSVPTRYGGSVIDRRELSLRRVHLLGGSPHKQIEVYREIPDNVVSIDGNYHQKMAVYYNKVWVYGAKRALGRWEKLSDYLGEKIKNDAPYVAFNISSKNITDAWKKELMNDI